ncbi:restriction endonuclease [Parasphingopyxis sp.]|uniref:restriction endonuclease n=1 Tax=Parasphingopyxis sp. TaxID=1920299 RepID=UPI00260D7E11|nr:restriction endonuclease [Parasphingopyxis sp.]
MADDLPKYDDFFLPTLSLLDQKGGSATIEEIETGLIAAFNLSERQLSATYEKSGALMIPDRMSWARSYLKYPGFLANPKRGVWVLTEEGRRAAQLDDQQVRELVAEAARRDWQKKKEQEELSLDSDHDPNTSSSEPEWSEKLLSKLQSIDPAAFERLSQRMLRENGFTRVEVTGRSGDGGIDGQGVLRLNLLSFHVRFQCKRYKGSVGAPAVRDFRGAMQGRADKGLIITTGSFTPDARQEATRDGAPAIDLIDGELLCELLKDLQLGVTVRQVIIEEVEILQDFFDDL